MQSDYAGQRGEEIRQMLINDAPKYGNDDGYADSLVRECYGVYVDEIAKYPNTRYGRGPIGGIRYSGTSSISANVGQGEVLYRHQMVAMQEHHWQKVTHHLIIWTKKVQLQF